MDAAGNIYIADSTNHRIRKVTAGGVISTYAGNGTSGSAGDGSVAVNGQLSTPTRLALDTANNLYISDMMTHKVRKVSATGMIYTYAGTGTSGYSGDGGQAIHAKLSQPDGVALDGAGNLYIADYGNYRVRKVTPLGVISTVAGNGTLGFSGDGGPALNAQFGYLNNLTVDSSGVIYASDSNRCVRKVALNGTITTVLGNGTQFGGDGGPATSAILYNPYGAVPGSGGSLYVVDYGNARIRKVAPGGAIATIAGNGASGYSGDGGPAVSAQLNGPIDVAEDPSGNLYIADYGNHTIRKVDTGGIISTFAGTGVPGFAGDGGPAISAQLKYPMGLAVDAAGNVYIADTFNYRIRRVTPAGVISTVVGTGTSGYSGDGGLATGAKLRGPTGLAFDSAGNLYFSDQYNHCVRKVTPAGIISTAAGVCGASGYSGDGGPATLAHLNNPYGAAIDGSGNLLIADDGNARIRKVAQGIISTIAGTGVAGYLGDGGPAENAKLFAPNSVSAGPDGRIYICDTLAFAVRVLTPTFGVSPYGVVNAASLAAPVAPGSLAAINGDYVSTDGLSLTAFPLPGSLEDVSFRFVGAPVAPLFFAGTAQAYVQIPWELAGETQTTVTVSRGGRTSSAETVALALRAPGIFSMNGLGTGQGSVVNSSYQLVDASHPAVAGSDQVQIYCTGLGPVTNQPDTGEASPSVAPSRTMSAPLVTIGGAHATVVSSGLVPGTVGLYQVTAQVPAGSARGAAVPVSITIEDATSNTVTIAVQ